jgi:hypothetical protein
MDPRRSKASILDCEQWLLGEASEPARERVEAALDEGARAALRSDDAALRERLFARLPPERLAAELTRRAAAPTRRRLPTWQLGVAVAACCALFVVLRSAGPRPEAAPDHDEQAAPLERVKGDELELRLYLQQGERIVRRKDGDRAAAHDVVQLGLKRGGYAFGVLVSLDGRGAVTLHFPNDPAGATALPSESGELLLPAAYELDDAPGFERFIFVATSEPVAASIVLEAARALARDPAHAARDPLILPVASAQRSLLLDKTEAR